MPSKAFRIALGTLEREVSRMLIFGRAAELRVEWRKADIAGWKVLARTLQCLSVSSNGVVIAC